MGAPGARTPHSTKEIIVGSRNRQRATFEKRQREIAKKERQAEKRARRQSKGDEPEAPSEYPTPGFPLGEYPDEAANTADADNPPVDSQTSTGT